jgi:hypothetical protein
MGTTRRILSVALAVVLTVALGACTGGSETDTAATASVTASTSESTATTPAAQSATDTTAGEHLLGLPDYPVSVSPDPSWTGVEPAAGTLSYRGAGDGKVISVHAVRDLAGTPQEEVPEDVAAFLTAQRSDIVVTDPRSVTHSGRPAQRFRVTMAEGRSPTDLWGAVGGSGYKPLPSEPMEVVATRSSEGLVFLWTEWTPEQEEVTLAAFDAALPRVMVG